jgi:Na+-driven multidrug efflux pump
MRSSAGTFAMQRFLPTYRQVIRLGLLCAAVAVLLCVASSAWACPTCKEDLANDPQGRGLAEGFYYSILLMMTAPFAVLGMLGFVAYRSIKRAQISDATGDVLPQLA